MPAVRLHTSKPVTPGDAQAIRQTIAAHLQEFLGKPPARCMIEIVGGCDLAMGDGAPGCAFVDITVQGAPPADTLSAFGAALSARLAGQLALPRALVYIHVLQITEAGVVGALL